MSTRPIATYLSKSQQVAQELLTRITEDGAPDPVEKRASGEGTVYATSLVCRAATKDTDNLSSRLIGLAVRSANDFSCAISSLISPLRSYDGRRHGAS